MSQVAAPGFRLAGAHVIRSGVPCCPPRLRHGVSGPRRRGRVSRNLNRAARDGSAGGLAASASGFLPPGRSRAGPHRGVRCSRRRFSVPGRLPPQRTGSGTNRNRFACASNRFSRLASGFRAPERDKRDPECPQDRMHRMLNVELSENAREQSMRAPPQLVRSRTHSVSAKRKRKATVWPFASHLSVLTLPLSFRCTSQGPSAARHRDRSGRNARWPHAKRNPGGSS